MKIPHLLLLLGLLSSAACGPQRMLSADQLEEKTDALWEQAARDLLAATGASDGRILLFCASERAATAAEERPLLQAIENRWGRERVTVITLPDAPRLASDNESIPVLARPLTWVQLSEAVSGQGPFAAVISLSGLPQGSPPAAGSPALVAFAPTAGDEVRALVRSGAVRAALVPARGVPASEKDWYRIRFRLLNASNIDTW